MCVCERERVTAAALCVCVLACVREEDKVTQPRLVCKHIRASLPSVTRLCPPFWLELMVQLRTLLTVFTLVLKAEARDYGKGNYISDAACGVRPITMHWVSCPIRADCACRKEGLCRKRLRKAGHRETTIMYSIWKIMCFLNIKACTHILLHQIMIVKKASYDPFKARQSKQTHFESAGSSQVPHSLCMEWSLLRTDMRFLSGNRTLHVCMSPIRNISTLLILSDHSDIPLCSWLTRNASLKNNPTRLADTAPRPI